MKVIVYVEGPSDQTTMQTLLRPLLQDLSGRGVSVRFVSAGGKQRVVEQSLSRAVNILRNDPESEVVVMPDLYPGDVGFAHATASQLLDGLRGHFVTLLKAGGIDDERLRRRFHAFCFKHDLEALVLAAEAPLAARLGADRLRRRWAKPVEDQDMNMPPKRVVERLFAERGGIYQDTVDAPLILGAAKYPAIAAACPQCFKPFVDYLESLP